MGTAGIERPKKNTRQEVRHYLDRHLKAHLGLRNIQMLDGHNQNVLANSDDGRLLLKFFREDVAHRASRCVLSNTLLAQHGLATPELVYADLDPARLSEFKLSCVATRWVPGEPMRPGDQSAACEAFKTLALIHNIRLGDLDEPRLREKGLPSLAQFQLASPTVRAGYEIEKIREVQSSIPGRDAKRVRAFLRQRLDRLAEVPTPRVLLHLDYQPANLLVTPGGELMVLDLELIGFGEFFLDLVRAQFKFCFRTNSGDLDRIQFRELIESDTFDRIMEAYLSCAPPEARAIWEEHFSTLIFWGYLRMTRRLAQRARRLAWHQRLSQRKLIKQVDQRWSQLLRFAETAEP